jgi:hypothetical protein
MPEAAPVTIATGLSWASILFLSFTERTTSKFAPLAAGLRRTRGAHWTNAGLSACLQSQQTRFPPDTDILRAISWIAERSMSHKSRGCSSASKNENGGPVDRRPGDRSHRLAPARLGDGIGPRASAPPASSQRAAGRCCGRQALSRGRASRLAAFRPTERGLTKPLPPSYT